MKSRLSLRATAGLAVVLGLSGCLGSSGSGFVEATLVLEDRGVCAGVPVAVVAGSATLDVVSGADGRLALDLAASDATTLRLVVDGYEAVERGIAGDGSVDLGEVTFALATVTAAGRVALDDGADPVGTDVAFDGTLAAVDGAGDWNCTNSGVAGRGDLEFGDAVSGSAGASQSFQIRDVQVDGDGSYEARVPQRARGLTVRAERDGYTRQEREVSDEEIDVSVSAGSRLSVSDIVLYPLTGFVNAVSGPYFATREIPLQISAFNGVQEMALGERGNAGCVYGDWQEYAAQASFTVSAGDGSKTICVRVRNDKRQQLSDLQVTVELDTLPPTAAALAIDGGADYISDPSGIVVLSLLAIDAGSGLAGMQLANRTGTVCDFDSLPVEDYVLNAIWALAAGAEGERTVCARFLDRAGNWSVAATGSIVFDDVAPTLIELAIDGGEVRIANPLVDVTVDQTGADEMLVATNLSFSGAVWSEVTTTVSLLLTGADGEKSVYLKLRDLAGNTVGPFATTVTLDTSGPGVPGVVVDDIDGDGFALQATRVELRITLPGDADLADLQLQRLVQGSDSVFAAHATALIDEAVGGQVLYADDVSATAGTTHRYRLRAVDDLGNVSDWSPEVAALPFEPIGEVLWIRSRAQDAHYFFPPQSGTFSILPTYAYIDDSGEETESDLLENIIAWDRPNSYADGRFNEQLVLRTANQDNSLVQQTTIGLALTTVTFVDSLGTVGVDVSLAVGPDGSFHMAYHDQDNDTLKYATNAGGVWQVEVVASGGSATGFDTSIDVDSAGAPHIAYRVAKSGANDELHYATLVSGTWQTELLEAGDAGWATALRVDSNDRVHIAYFDESSNDAKYVNNVAGPWDYETIEAAGNVGADISLALDANDAVHLAYRDETNDKLRYAHNTTGPWHLEHVSTPGNIGTDPDIEVDTDGFVHISHRDNDVLDLAYSNNVTGTWDTEVVGYGGLNSDLVLDGDGHVYISYSIGALLVATNRTGTWANHWVDYAYGAAARPTGIHIARNGAMYLAYHDDTFANLAFRYETRFIDEAEEVVVSGSNQLLSPHLFVDGDDELAFAYWADHDDAARVATRDADGTWWSSFAVTTNNSTRNVDAVMDADGDLHLCYSLNGADGVMYAHNKDGAFVPELVDTAGGEYVTCAIALDSAGNAHIVFEDDNAGGVRYVSNSGGGWAAEGIPGTPDDPRHPALVVDPAGTVHVVYYDFLAAELWYANNATGGWALAAVDDSPKAGFSVGNLLLDDETMYLSYINGSDGSLHYAWAATADGAWQTQLIDGSGDVDSASSIYRDDDGALHVSYREGQPSRLAYATNRTGRWSLGHVEKDDYSGEESTILVLPNGRAAIGYTYDGSDGLRFITNFEGVESAVETEVVAPF